MGNRVVYIPGDQYQNIVLELVSVMETSDIPGGVINIVTGDKNELSTHLAGHGEVESMWCWGDNKLNKNIETAIWHTDFFISPGYRSKGYGKLLAEAWMKICPNQMAMCSPYSLRVLKKFGWSFNFDTKRLIRPINYLKFVPVLNKLNLNFLDTFLRSFIKNRFKDKISIKPYKISENFKLISESFNLRKLPSSAKNYPKIDRKFTI